MRININDCLSDLLNDHKSYLIPLSPRCFMIYAYNGRNGESTGAKIYRAERAASPSASQQPWLDMPSVAPV